MYIEGQIIQLASGARVVYLGMHFLIDGDMSRMTVLGHDGVDLLEIRLNGSTELRADEGIYVGALDELVAAWHSDHYGEAITDEVYCVLIGRAIEETYTKVPLERENNASTQA